MLVHKNFEYVPALGHRVLTPAYDLLSALFMREATLKKELVRLADIQDGQIILDVGCGTGTLLLLLKETYPGGRLVGVDPDPEILAIARRKIERAQQVIQLDQGSATNLPYPNSFFDTVFSSLVIHHLDRYEKTRAFAEIYRVLRPGGKLYLSDFGKPHNPLMHAVSLIIRYFEEAYDNVKGRIPAMLRDAGFVSDILTQHMTIFGTVSLYQAVKSRGA